MGKQNKTHQVMRHDGNMADKPKAVTKFLTWDAATAARGRERMKLQEQQGSSDWFTVQETRRKGRSK